MIVEFIGCTGSGKTTLIRELQSRLGREASVAPAAGLLQSRLGLPNLSNPTLQNVLQEIAGFPLFMRSLYRHRAFIGFSVRMLARRPSLSIGTVCNLRSLERKIGTYEIARRYSRDHIVLLDEGPILAAHMFVFSGSLTGVSEVDEFAASLPLPDLVVYVRVAPDTVVARTLKRPDPPRKLATRNPIQIEMYARGAHAVFERLVEAENIKRRLLVVDNDDSSGIAHDSVVDSVANSILGRYAAVNDHPTSLQPAF